VIRPTQRESLEVQLILEKLQIIKEQEEDLLLA